MYVKSTSVQGLILEVKTEPRRLHLTLGEGSLIIKPNCMTQGLTPLKKDL